MKISIGSKIVDGPWGGGNLFVKNLSEYLKNIGCEVYYDLTIPDLDLILLTDPRSKISSNSTFNHKDINFYKKYINQNVAIVQRINECDERKDTVGVNSYYLKASKVADSIIFVSSWLEKIYLNIGLPKHKSKVILAGANENIFNNHDLKIWNGKEKFKIVTHHWSSHKNKGFQDYLIIDELLTTNYWNKKIEFTYIGNINNEYSFKNINVLGPLSGQDLANELKKHHFYMTGSINEPSGNHHIEAAQCGLPIIYKASGGIPEYCKGFGVSYLDDLESAMLEAIKNYSLYSNKIKNYPLNSNKMSGEFYSHFKKIIEEKEFSKKIFYPLKNLFISYFLLQKIVVSFTIMLRFHALKFLKKLLGKN